MSRPSPWLLLAGIVAVAVPVALSVYLAGRLAMDAEYEHAGLLAQTVLQRSDAIARQVIAAAERIDASGERDPCSPRNIALMRQIVLESTYLQAVGHISGERLMCSSLGDHGKGIPLGPVRYVSSLGVAIRTGILLPMAPGQKLLVSERKGTAVVLHPDLPTDLYAGKTDLAVGVFSASTGVPMSVRGGFRPAWAAALDGAAEKHFVDRDQVVAVRRSATFDIASYAAVPLSHQRQRARAMMVDLVPAGLLVGALFALALAQLVRQQQSLPAMMRTALARNEFYLEYQPIADLRTRRWVGAEALVRWKRADGPMVRPDAFIPVAEDNGLICRITERVIAMIAADARNLVARHPDFHISINLSAADLESGRTVGLLGDLVRSPGFSPRNVFIEATERGLLDAEVVRGVLQDIRALGIRAAIDDFGTGYSGLSYLGTFELDYLKIDKAFVDTVGTDAVTHDVAVHIIELAKTLELEMIAEGVEREAQAEFLCERGVQYGQGWLFSRPLSMQRLLAELDARAVQAGSPAP